MDDLARWLLAHGNTIRANPAIHPDWCLDWAALLPRLAAGPGQLVRANGVLAQCGASGSLLGPPLMAASVQAGGWTAAAALGLLVSLAAMPLAWRALRGA